MFLSVFSNNFDLIGSRTAQGVCFELTCKKINDCQAPRVDSLNGSMNDIRANLSANWTIIYQVSDIVVFLSLSMLPILASTKLSAVLFFQTLLGAITAVLGLTFDDLDDKGSSFDLSAILAGVSAVPKQFRDDCRATLFAPFVFGFGITTAMFAYYLNANVVSNSESLGEVSLGFLEAFSYFVATASAYPYAFISNSFTGGQHIVIQFGSLCFMLTGVVVIFLSNEELSTWTNILIIKGLYGLLLFRTETMLTCL